MRISLINFIFPLMLFGTILLFSSCSKEEEEKGVNFNDPMSSFYWETEDLEGSRLKVSFKNASENADKWEWDFGDGSPKNFTKEPSHIYPRSQSVSREYLIILTVTNSLDGRFNRRSKVLTINPS